MTHRHSIRRRKHGAPRKATVIIACTLAALLGTYGIAAAVTQSLSLGAGDTASVTCAGDSLSVTSQERTSLTLNCSPSSTTPTTTSPTTTTPPTTTTTTTTPPPSGTWWTPPVTAEWQWEIDHPLDTSNATDMGTGLTAYNEDTPPATNPTIYDIDAIENPASTVSALHALGDHAICYIEVGTAGDYYSASDEGIPTTYYDQFQAAGVLGDKLSGYPENFLNITSSTTVSIVESMIQQQCAAKGFDAVETDLDETYSGSDGTTGFIISQAAEQTYLTTLATYMHSLGLSWIAKNLDDTGDNFATMMEPLADGIISEQCGQYGTCGALSAFASAGKWIGEAEYNLPTSQFCPAAIAANRNAVLFPESLNGGRQPCQ